MTSSIAVFYKDKNVFITGGTGFLGKVLVEKLVLSCPEVAGIYLLIRPSEKQTSQDRLDTIVDGQMFERVRTEIPDFRHKLHAIAGDISKPALGISQSETDMLLSKVNIVFHSAATVRFDEPLRTAMQLNVIGTRNVTRFCRGIKHLQSFVHVSTAYANCDRSCIEEVIYPPPVHPQKLIDALEWMNDSMIEKLTPALIGKRPNTYTFSKACAEYMLTQEAADLPMAIVRPSIICPSWREPFEGWIDSYSGVVAYLAATGTGLLQALYGHADARVDIIPVDTVANQLIAVAWDTAVARSGNILVYNATSGGVNPLTFRELVGTVVTLQRKYPPDYVLRRAKMVWTNNSFLYQYRRIVSHIVPAYLGDMVLRIIGRKPRLVKLYNKVDKVVQSGTFFATHEFDWSHDNTDTLLAKMGEKEKMTFAFDCRDLHWPTYIDYFVMGIKAYLLKEDMDKLPQARARLNKLRIIQWGFNTILILLLWRLLMTKSQKARNIWHLVTSFPAKFFQYLLLPKRKGQTTFTSSHPSQVTSVPYR